MLNLVDEHTRECLLVRPERRWSSAKVIEALADVARRRFISSPAVHGSTAIARASTRKLWDEFLNGEIFYSLKRCWCSQNRSGAWNAVQEQQVLCSLRLSHSTVRTTPLIDQITSAAAR